MRPRLLLLPLAWLYSLILGFRHFLYDHGIFNSNSGFSAPVICIGNLNLGGTGKTPFTEYLIRILSIKYKIGIVSRGYGRSTKGFILATTNHTAEIIGDEPKQILNKFHAFISLAVCEDRTHGITQLLKLKPEINLIILDDAFQHRKVSADINILLSPYEEPFHKDFLIPAGNLRDIKSAAKRADFVVFTKSPKGSSLNKLGYVENSRYWLSEMAYDEITAVKSTSQEITVPFNLLLVSGIAKPEYLERHAKSICRNMKSMIFPDHHKYTSEDILKIAHIFDTFAPDNKAILTTEKDWVKLSQLKELQSFNGQWLIAPIRFRLENETQFIEQLETALAVANRRK